MKINYFFLYIFLLILTVSCYSKGIIIADDVKQTTLFSTVSTDSISSFANTICLKYDKVILHLGRKFVFRSGNIFSSERAKLNLQLFCTTCFQKKIPVYLWFFDCHGGENFIELYSQHKEIIEENIKALESMEIKYDGIAIDMEWINKDNYNNSSKLDEVIKTLRSSIGNKKLFYFTSLIDNENSNINRGYNIKKLSIYNAQPITMLYINDGGFILKNNKTIPELNDERIKSLRKFYKKNAINVAVSLEKCVLLKSNSSSNFIKIQSSIYDLADTITFRKINKYNFYNISEYIVTKTCEVKYTKKEIIEIKKGDVLFVFEPNENKLLKADDYVWEYFILN